MEQRGAFNDLLDLYIARDGDLPDDNRLRAHDLAVDIRVWTRIRRSLIEAGKIESKGGSLVPTGAATTLATCLAKSVAAREAADSRWRKAAANSLEKNEINNTAALPNIMLLRQDKEDISISSNIPKNEIGAAIAAYNEVAKEHNLPVAKKITVARTAKIRQRLKDAGGLDGWMLALEKVKENPWLMGDNDRGWRVDLDFLGRESSFAKLMEGSYDHHINASTGERIGKPTLRDIKDHFDAATDLAEKISH